MTDTLADIRPPARYVKLSKGAYVEVGSLAATGILHGYAPSDGGLCFACFGHVCDPQHAFHKTLPPGRVRNGHR
jgi:hypothetical protein